MNLSYTEIKIHDTYKCILTQNKDPLYIWIYIKIHYTFTHEYKYESILRTNKKSWEKQSTERVQIKLWAIDMLLTRSGIPWIKSVYISCLLTLYITHKNYRTLRASCSKYIHIRKYTTQSETWSKAAIARLHKIPSQNRVHWRAHTNMKTHIAQFSQKISGSLIRRAEILF